MRHLEIPKLVVPFGRMDRAQRTVACAIHGSAVGDAAAKGLSDAELRAAAPYLSDFLQSDAERDAARGLFEQLRVPLPPALAVAPEPVVSRVFGPPRLDADGQPVRTTRLVNTLGPASSDPAVMARMMEAGSDVFRLNFSHLRTLEDAQALVENIREAERLAGRSVRLLADLPGPKLRLGRFEGERTLVPGERVTFHGGETDLAAGLLQVEPPTLLDEVEPGHRIFLNDGKVQLRVAGRSPGVLEAEVVDGGPISSRKGMNLPDTPLRERLPSQDDLSAIKLLKALDALGHRIDLVAFSYVELPEDVRAMRAAIPWDVAAVAKIERPLAMENLRALTQEADALMDARGDRKVEMGAESIPGGQAQIHEQGAFASTPTGTATQVVSSMVGGGPPTNAEINDVYTSILQGAEFVMTSEETAMGADPVGVVATLHQLVLGAEAARRGDGAPTRAPAGDEETWAR